MLKTVFAFAAGAAALVAASAASAAPQVAGSLYQESASATCSASTVCQVLFTKLAPDMALRVDQVECRITVPNTVDVYSVGLNSFTQGAIGGRTFIPVVGGKSLGGPSQKTFVGQVASAAFFAGSQPLVTMYTSVATNVSATCTIAGTRKYVSQW